MNQKVYVLQHERELNGSSDVKFLGVYSSDENAKEAIARFRKLSGFSDYPEGFYIDDYDLDQDHWSGGFVTE